MLVSNNSGGGGGGGHFSVTVEITGGGASLPVCLRVPVHCPPPHRILSIWTLTLFSVIQ